MNPASHTEEEHEEETREEETPQQTQRDPMNFETIKSELLKLEKFFSWENHPFWNPKHNIPEKIGEWFYDKNSDCDWNKMLRYISVESEKVDQLLIQYDPVVWTCAFEFLNQYISPQYKIARFVNDQNERVRRDFEKTLQRYRTSNFTFQVIQNSPKSGYFFLSDLLFFFDSKISPTLKAIFKDREEIEFSSPGQRMDITLLLDYHLTNEQVFVVQDLITLFKLPYLLSHDFNYSDCVTPLIYASTLGVKYRDVVLELAQFYGRDALLIPCEDNSRFDGYRVVVINLMKSDPVAAREIMDIYKITQKEFDDVREEMGLNRY